ncbi:hypothetical protein VO419_004318 [Vibrio parahaemolyticus]|nr:hypothetical protein [Vibrio parahaemolyticus]
MENVEYLDKEHKITQIELDKFDPTSVNVLDYPDLSKLSRLIELKKEETSKREEKVKSLTDGILNLKSSAEIQLAVNELASFFVENVKLVNYDNLKTLSKALSLKTDKPKSGKSSNPTYVAVNIADFEKEAPNLFKYLKEFESDTARPMASNADVFVVQKKKNFSGKATEAANKDNFEKVGTALDKLKLGSHSLDRASGINFYDLKEDQFK